MESHRRDRGVSLIELLISISILGTVGVAMLASLQTSIIASRIERDHAQAHEWLQSSTEVLVNDVEWSDCDPADSINSAETLRALYESELRAKSTIIPPSWDPSRLEVPVVVQFAGPDGSYGSACLETEDRQRITIRVTNNGGDIIEEVDVVKVPR